jgi:hypothetical protein
MASPGINPDNSHVWHGPKQWFSQGLDQRVGHHGFEALPFAQHFWPVIKYTSSVCRRPRVPFEQCLLSWSRCPLIEAVREVLGKLRYASRTSLGRQAGFSNSKAMPWPILCRRNRGAERTQRQTISLNYQIQKENQPTCSMF